MGLFVLAESAVVVALVFFAVSLYLYAAQATAPWLAAALTGLAALIVAALLVLVTSLLRGRRRREASRRGGGDADRVADAALEALLSGEKLHPSDMVMTSLVAGVVLGASPALRRQLAEHLGRRRDGDERSATSGRDE